MGKEVGVKIVGKDETGAAFRAVTKSADELNRRVSALTRPLDLLKSAFAGLGAVGLASFFKSSVDSAAAADAAWGRAASALDNAGISSRLAKGELDELFTSIQNTTRFADDDATTAFATLMGITNNYTESVKNLTVAADIAAAKQISLNDAATIVGKVATGNTAILKRYGMAVREGSDAMEQLREHFAGFASRDANTLQGQLQQIANGWDNVKEAVGRALTGTDAGAGGIAKSLNGLGNWIDENRPALTDFIEQLGTVAKVLGRIAMSFVNVTYTVMQGYSILGEVAAKYTGARDGPEDAGDGAYYKALGRIKARQNAKLAAEAKANAATSARIAAEDAGAEARKQAEREVQREQDRRQKRFDDLHVTDSAEGRAMIGQTRAPRIGTIGPISRGGPAVSVDSGESTFGEDMRRGTEEAREAFGQLDTSISSVGETLGRLRVNGIQAFATDWSDAIGEVITGHEKLGVAILTAGRRAIGGVLVADGRANLLKAAAAAAEGLVNPINFVRAAKLFGVGTAEVALGSAFSGGGGGSQTPGSGISPAGMADSQKEVAGQGKATIYFPAGKSVLRTDDPDDREAVAEMFKSLFGTREIEIVVGNA